MKSVSAPYLVFICIILLMLFNYPVMEIANSHEKILGIPSMPFYFFMVWIAAILLLYYLSLKMFKSNKEDE